MGEGGGGRGRRWEREEVGEGGGERGGSGRGRRWEREKVGEGGGGRGRRWEREEVAQEALIGTVDKKVGGIQQ